MTWEELIEEAKKIGALIDVFDKFIAMGDVWFWKNGEINILGRLIANNRTPEQMWQIMEALK